MKFRLCTCKNFLGGKNSDTVANLPPICRDMDDVYVQGFRRGIDGKMVRNKNYDTADRNSKVQSSVQRENLEKSGNYNNDGNRDEL